MKSDREIAGRAAQSDASLNVTDKITQIYKKLTWVIDLRLHRLVDVLDPLVVARDAVDAQRNRLDVAIVPLLAHLGDGAELLSLNELNNELFE
jgi:hypothetical protein